MDAGGDRIASSLAAWTLHKRAHTLVEQDSIHTGIVRVECVDCYCGEVAATDKSIGQNIGDVAANSDASEIIAGIEGRGADVRDGVGDCDGAQTFTVTESIT